MATITTDSNGVAETPWLTYGIYRVEETGVPEHYVDNGFSVEAVINEEDMGTYLVDCDNEPTKGWIQLVKVDPCGLPDRCQWRYRRPSLRSALRCGHGSGWRP